MWWDWQRSTYFSTRNDNIDTSCSDDKVIHLFLHLTIPLYACRSQMVLVSENDLLQACKRWKDWDNDAQICKQNTCFSEDIDSSEDLLSFNPLFIHLMSHWLYHVHVFIFFPFIKILTCWKVLRINGNEPWNKSKLCLFDPRCDDFYGVG